MRFTHAASVLACLVVCAPAPAAQGDLDDDADQLEGSWVEFTRGQEFRISFQVGQSLQISVGGENPRVLEAAVGRLSKVQEDGRGRFVEMQEGTSRYLPRRLYFRFDRSDLILDISEGPLAGEHRFVRDRGQSPPSTGRAVAAWAVGGLVVVACLIAVVVTMRRRSRRATEAGSVLPTDEP
jgi:hypothetical protein